MIVTRDELVELAKEEARKRAVVDAHAAMNVYGLSAEARVDASAAYRVAQDEWRRAAAAYMHAEQHYVPAHEPATTDRSG